MNRGINASAGGGSCVFVVIIHFVLLDGGLSPTSLCRVGSGGGGHGVDCSVNPFTALCCLEDERRGLPSSEHTAALCGAVK